MNVNTKRILLLPLIFLFLPAFYIPIKLLVPSYMLVSLLILLTFFIFKYKSMLYYFINKLYKKTSFKYLTYFCLWLFFQMTILLISGNIPLLRYISALIIFVCGYFLLYYLYPAFSCKYLTIKQIKKFLMIGFFCIFIWGIVSYLGLLFHIKVLNIVTTILSNRQFLQSGEGLLSIRARSTFFEPGTFAYFINFNLPFFYMCSKSKYRVFKNKFTNFIVKKSLLPMAYLNIFLSFSAMGYIFATIITIFYNRKIILKHFIPIIIFLTLLCASFNVNALKSNVVPLLRINVVINMISNGQFLKLVQSESSLFSRIVSYTNTYCLFSKHWLLGVGIDQGKYIMQKQYENSPLPLTIENQTLLLNSYRTGKLIYNQSILSSSLLESGLVGFMLLYMFLLSTIKSLDKILPNVTFAQKEFLISIKFVLLTFIFLSFYESSLMNMSYQLFLCAFINNITIIYQNRKDL